MCVLSCSCCQNIKMYWDERIATCQKGNMGWDIEGVSEACIDWLLRDRKEMEELKSWLTGGQHFTPLSPTALNSSSTYFLPTQVTYYSSYILPNLPLISPASLPYYVYKPYHHAPASSRGTVMPVWPPRPSDLLLDRNIHTTLYILTF